MFGARRSDVLEGQGTDGFPTAPGKNLYASNTIMPALFVARAAQRRIRIWSTAASTGQEPYSLAIALKEMGAAISGWRIERVILSGRSSNRLVSSVIVVFSLRWAHRADQDPDKKSHRTLSASASGGYLHSEVGRATSGPGRLCFGETGSPHIEGISLMHRSVFCSVAGLVVARDAISTT